MHRKFIALVIAAALAVTGINAAPAEARDRAEAAAVIAGVAALAIIGAALANDRARRNDGYVSRGSGYYGNRYDDDFQNGYRRDHDGYRGHDRGYNERRPVVLPAACRVRVKNRVGYSDRCLRGQYGAHRNLPGACAINVGGHHHRIFDDRCLNQYGYY